MEKESMLTDLNKGRFDLVLLQVSVFELNLLRLFFSSDQIPHGEVTDGKNRWRYRSAPMDAALEQGRVGTTHEQRRAGYFQAQLRMAEDLPVIPLWHEDVVAVHSGRLRDYVVPRDARFGTLAYRKGTGRLPLFSYKGVGHEL
jgi:peptide/nickel transport system substrate-binding protein